jgi:hypothetical protein
MNSERWHVYATISDIAIRVVCRGGGHDLAGRPRCTSSARLPDRFATG